MWLCPIDFKNLTSFILLLQQEIATAKSFSLRRTVFATEAPRDAKSLVVDSPINY